ncbi:hypothetical protein ACA910_012199 [Epithemia clementina (nom. ined.)]
MTKLLSRASLALAVCWAIFCNCASPISAFTPTRASSLFTDRRAIVTVTRGKQTIVSPRIKADSDTRTISPRNPLVESNLWGSRNTLNPSDDDHNAGRQRKVRRWFTNLRSRVRNFFLRCTLILVFATTILQALFPFGGGVMGNHLFRPQPAHASAPIMALPKAEDLDPGKEALMRHEKEMAKKAQRDLDEMAKKAREIESTEGAAARSKFEQECKVKEQEQAEKRAQGFVQLKRELLDQGIDPFCDIEGQRQSILHEKGLDLGDVSGTPFNLERVQQKRNPKKSFIVRKAPNREVIRLMVEDLKARDMDPLEYFESHKDQTMTILEMSAPKAMSLVEMYKANLEEYGQITKPQPGELSVKERKAQEAAILLQDPKAQAEQAKQQKAEAKAKAQAEREEAKLKAKAERERAKAEAKAEKERLKVEKAKAAQEKEGAAKREKMAAAGIAASAAGVGAGAVTATMGAAESVGSAAGSALESMTDNNNNNAPITTTLSPSSTSSVDEDGSGESAGEVDDVDNLPSTIEPSSTALTTSSSGDLQQKIIKVIPASVVVVGIGAGVYGFNVYRKRAAEEEEERQRQFRMLMQGDQADNSATKEKPNAVDGQSDSFSTKTTERSAPTLSMEPPAPVAPSPKKRRLGIFKSKRGGGRETDLRVLVSDDAQAPEFASLLGKILAFGAPGRFPNSLAVLGNDMPLEQFDLEEAKEMLINARLEADLEVAQSAEIFANVVNCMLIEIMDLASSSLKEKDSKSTVDAINIVVDFMNHAASLYDAVAESTTIAPVTYCGTLSRSKLEQMYSDYAVGGMMDMDNTPSDFDSRVALLRDVLSISEKKSEGLLLKAMQKNMAEIMKNTPPEEMEELMKSMTGMEGIMGADGGDGVDQEQLKAMLREFKAAKDRGEYSKQELEQVRKMFKEMFGSNLEELFKEAENATEEDREVMELMKAVLDD